MTRFVCSQSSGTAPEKQPVPADREQPGTTARRTDETAGQKANQLFPTDTEHTGTRPEGRLFPVSPPLGGNRRPGRISQNLGLLGSGVLIWAAISTIAPWLIGELTLYAAALAVLTWAVTLGINTDAGAASTRPYPSVTESER